MPVAGFQSLQEHQYRTDFIASISAGGAGERMEIRGTNYGRDTARYFSGGFVGKTLLITDTLATSVAQKEIKFKASDFANVNRPTLAEIVAALNAAFAADATPTVASAGAQGELVLQAAAASATGGITLGAGTANVLLGLPKSGVTVAVINGTGITVTFPAGAMSAREYQYGRAPYVDVQNYTSATAVRTGLGTGLWTSVYTPSARTLLITNTGGAARLAHIRIAY